MADLADRTDDVSIHDETKTKTVAVITDGSGVHRLAVDVVANTTTPGPDNLSELVKLGKVYSVALSVNMALAGTANPLVLIKNPSGSGKTLYLARLTVGVDVENNFANFVLFANPTIITKGTTRTPVNRNIGGGFGASSMEAYSLPTISSNGSALLNVEVASNGNSIESVQDFSIHLKPNNNLLLTGDPKSNNRAAVVTLVWAEV